MKLIPLAMIVPNKEGVYAPSKLRKPFFIDYEEFVSKYADWSRTIKVSFSEDGVSSPQLVTAYGRGLDVWYLVE